MVLLINMVRSVIFNCLFFTWTASVILCSPFLAMASSSVPICKSLRVWSHVSMFLCRWIMGISTEIRGLENIPKDSPAIVVAKHQSNFDAVLAWQLRDRLTAFAKKELFRVPLLGVIFNKIGVIRVDRGSGKSFDEMQYVANYLRETNNLILIFPEATRVPPGVRKKLKSGAYHLYKGYDIPVYTIATNTGQFWRKGFWHSAGKVVYEIGAPLPQGLEKKDFMAAMHERVVLRSDELMREQGMDLPPYEEQPVYTKKRK